MEREGGALPMNDFKSALQETLQGLGMAQPSYILVEEAGAGTPEDIYGRSPAASERRRGAEFVGRAQGSTKKTAEQDAARQLLSYLASRRNRREPNWFGDHDRRSTIGGKCEIDEFRKSFIGIKCQYSGEHSWASAVNGFAG